MPKRTDLRKILIIGSGPIVIGQACEFDYSGTQGCRALREEGFEIVLVNSNPATIMTDPEMASRTYVEPLTPEFVAKIIERERPDALLPTLGGQTALNLAVALHDDGTLERFGVELIGAKIPAIRKAEDRELFKRAIERIGLTLPRSGYARTTDEARTIVRTTGYPAIGPRSAASTIPRSTAGMYCRGITPPTILSSNTKPEPRGSGARRIQQSPYWPRPPVCFLCLPCPSALPFSVSR